MNVSQDLLLRIKSSVGMSRITINKSATLADLKAEISKKLKIEGILTLLVDNWELKEKDTTKLALIKLLKEGTEILVNIKEVFSPNKLTSEHKASLKEPEQHVLTGNCNHPPTARCINCMTFDKKSAVGAKKEEPVESSKIEKKEKENVSKCAHGPGGKCINCLVESSTTSDKKKLEKKWLCQHGPNGKCSHCLDDDKLQDVKHIAFDEFLSQRKLNCSNHPPEAKCNNCLPPSAISYKMNLDCKSHPTFPKAMCNKCMPPSCIVKRQEYRHVDYAQFMNFKEVTNFVNEWVQNSFAKQKVGFLYGYYAEDPNYKGGVRAIIEAIYEPPQIGDISGFSILEDPAENSINFIAESLGLERVGWIYTDMNHDAFLDSKSLRKAAKYQEDFKTLHPSGYTVSKFITVVVRTRKENSNEVAPEVYMVSDQAQALERDNIFTESERRRVLKIREPENINDILPTIICQGKPEKEIEPDFFLVNIASGQPKNNNFAILKHSDFPIENRAMDQTLMDLKNYMQKYSKELSHIKFSDFHLLIFLVKILDIDTSVRIAYCVRDEIPVDGEIENIIKQMTQN